MTSIAHNNINNNQHGTVNVGGNRNARGGTMNNNNNNQNNGGTTVPPVASNTNSGSDWTKIGVISTLISTIFLAVFGGVFWLGSYSTKADYSKEKIQTIEGNYVTKEDLKDLVTKKDLSNLVTRDDIKDLATKQDVNGTIQIVIDMLNTKK